MLLRSSHSYAVYHVHPQQLAWQPPTDVYETEMSLVIQLEVPGMRDGHFHLSLHDGVLIITGTRVENIQERRAYHHMEINNGDFRAEVELPIAVDVSKMRADYDDGYLKITLPRQ